MGLRNDYHVGRRYAAGPTGERHGPAAWLVSRLKSMFRPKSWELPGAESGGFSLIGDDSHSGRPVFPMADWAVRANATRRIGRPANDGGASTGQADRKNP